MSSSTTFRLSELLRCPDHQIWKRLKHCYPFYCARQMGLCRVLRKVKLDVIQSISRLVDEKLMPFWKEKTSENSALRQCVMTLQEALCEKSTFTRKIKMQIIIREMRTLKEKISATAADDDLDKLFHNGAAYLCCANLLGEKRFASIYEAIDKFNQTKSNNLRL